MESRLVVVVADESLEIDVDWTEIKCTDEADPEALFYS